MNKNAFNLFFSVIFCLSIVLYGCSQPTIYVHPTPGFDKIKKIAIMPFNNLSTDDKAGEKVRNSFVVELLKTESFGVLDTNETDRILHLAGLLYNETQDSSNQKQEEGITALPLSKKIGDILHVEAILTGSVEEYSINRFGDQEVPSVSVSVRLLDAESGIIIWASTYTKRGSVGIPILGWGKVTSLSNLSNQVAQDMALSLSKYTH